ncbi:uncharacterized protein TNCV_1560351 [Trichonephila clavipes]|nr:uncharacterized protein TNCV_1560351 [Trichonephila clavipes]
MQDTSNLLMTDKDRRANRYINERLSLKSHLPGSVPLEYLDFCVRGKFCHLAQENRGLIVVKGSDQRKIFEKLGLFTTNLEISPHFRDLNDRSLPDHLHDEVHEDFNISECTMVKSYRFARYLQHFNKLQTECKRQMAHLVDHVETLYEGQRSCNGSSRSHPEKFKGSSKTSNEESKGRKSIKDNFGWEDPRLKRQMGPSHLRDARQGKPPTERSKHDMTGQYDKARETRTTTSGTNRASERRPVRSKQGIAVRSCPYYLRSRVKQPEGIPEERRSIGIDSIPQNNIRRKSLSFEALDGDSVDMSE